MRFRLLFIIFNVVILISFGLIFLMPALVLGWEYTSVFWSANWPIGAAFVAVLLGLNGFFLRNWRLFTYLEQEDWHGVVEYLEPRVLKKARPSAARTRVLINAYLMDRKSERIGDLAARLDSSNPGLANRLALALTIPRLLGGDGETLTGEIAGRLEATRLGNPVWMRWCHAVALLMSSRLEEARDELLVVVESASDVLLRVLAASMLEPYRGQEESIGAALDLARDQIRQRYTREKLENRLERERGSLHIVLLTSQIQSGIDWVYETEKKNR